MLKIIATIAILVIAVAVFVAAAYGLALGMGVVFVGNVMIVPAGAPMWLAGMSAGTAALATMLAGQEMIDRYL